MKMFIGNDEVLCSKDFTITQEMLSTSSIILNNVFPKTWDEEKDYTTNFYFPRDYSKFKMLDDDDNLIFAGIVKNTGNISLDPREPHYASIQVLDFKTFLSEGETLDFVIDNKTIVEAINMVVEKVQGYGFIVGEINILNEDDIIKAYNTQNQTAYDVLQYLSEISQSRWITRMVDEDTIAIDFYDPTLMPEGTELEYNDDFFEEQKIIDMKYSYSTNDYRNKQVMLSSDVYGSIDYTDDFTTSGYSKVYNTSERIGTMKHIYEDGVEKIFATQEERNMGISADYYYTPGTNEIESEDVISQGVNLAITYTPLVKGRQVIYNLDEVNRIADNTNRKGVIARYETRNDVLNVKELQSVGESYIKYKGTSEITLTIQTENNNIWDIGEVVEWNDAPLEELQKTYMVKKKTINMIVAKETIGIFYTFELSSSYNNENAINYFDNQRRKATGNIEQGQFIDRNYDIEETATLIFDNFGIKNTITNINVLDCTLDCRFNA